MIDIEDFILIKKIQSGDTEAFEILVHKYYGIIYQFCYRRMNGDLAMAADVTQDVFLKLLEHIQSVRLVGKIQNYLFTIAVNTCNNYFKKTASIYRDMEKFDIIDDSSGPYEKAVQAETKDKIRQAISNLPDYQKDVIILRFYHDLKIREIAQITEVSIPTVKSRLQQGLKNYKDI